jgi:glycosyltransferase involved in cell wall biosynthesis
MPTGSAVPRLFLTVGDEGPDEQLPQGVLMRCGAVAEPERMAQYFRAADIYVHAARADTFPSVVLEAMACGTAVVATAVDGIVEQVVSLDSAAAGVAATGVLTPRDPSAMANAMARLLDDAELSTRLGAAGRERVLDRFDERPMVSSYLDLYRRLH